MNVKVQRAGSIAYPATWGEHYTPEDIRDVKGIVDWLNTPTTGGRDNIRSMTKLAKLINLSPALVNNVLKGSYASPVTEHVKKIWQAISVDEQRSKPGVRQRLAFIDTSVTRTVNSACHRAHIYGDIGIISGKPGTGKTEGIKRYAAENSDAALVYASVNMNESTLLDSLVEATKAEVITASRYSRGTKADKYAAVIRALKGTHRLIIIDEADLMNPSCLEVLRRINDETGVGVVMVGEPRLDTMISNREGRFSRIQSRVGFWVPVIASITPDDSHALATASLDGYEVNDQILDAFWQCCEGSARTLSKLIPNIRDFGLSKGHQLTPELIFSVAQQTLRIRPGSRHES